MVLRKKPGARDVVTLADLAPRHDVKGGSQRVFGSDPIDVEWRKGMTTKLKDLPPKSPAKIKGGRKVD